MNLGKKDFFSTFNVKSTTKRPTIGIYYFVLFLVYSNEIEKTKIKSITVHIYIIKYKVSMTLFEPFLRREMRQPRMRPICWSAARHTPLPIYNERALPSALLYLVRFVYANYTSIPCYLNRPSPFYKIRKQNI